MDRRSEAALRTAVSIVPGTPVLGIGVGSGDLAVAMMHLSIAYSFCETDLTRVEELARRVEIADEFEPFEQVSVTPEHIDCIDEQFNWAFVVEADSPAGIQEMTIPLAKEIVRILKLGGWIWLACNDHSALAGGSTVFHEIGCVDASPVTRVSDHEFCYRILRKVDANTPV